MRLLLLLLVIVCVTEARADYVPQGATSVILERCLYDDTTGEPLTGLDYTSTGLVITLRRDGAALASYTSAGATIEDIAALGTWVAPTGIRFAEIGTTGCYQFQFADSVFASGDRLLFTVADGGSLSMLDHDENISLHGGWDVICEPDNSPAFSCAEALRLVLAYAWGQGSAPTSLSSWTVSTPDGGTQRGVQTFGTDQGDRTISVTP